MLDPKPRKMTLEEYLVWEERQEEKHELIDGVPVPRWPKRPGQPEAMAGASNRHNKITANLMFALRKRLQGGPSEPFGSDAKLACPSGRTRYPDVTVQCGPYDPLAAVLPTPTVVFEVLSPSNTWFDQTRRLEDYQSIASVQHIVVLAQDEARGQVWSRGAGGSWSRVDVEGSAAALDLPAIGITLPCAEVYEDIALKAPSGGSP